MSDNHANSSEQGNEVQEQSSIILDLQEFDLSDLESLKGTALGNILEKLDRDADISIQNTSHKKHTSHSSHAKFSQSIW